MIQTIQTTSDLISVGENKRIVAVLFGAPWNQGTRKMEDLLDEIQENHPDYTICFSNVEESQDLAIQYNITSFPSLVFFNDKVLPVSTVSGVLSLSSIENKFAEILA